MTEGALGRLLQAVGMLSACGSGECYDVASHLSPSTGVQALQEQQRRFREMLTSPSERALRLTRLRQQPWTLSKL